MGPTIFGFLRLKNSHAVKSVRRSLVQEVEVCVHDAEFAIHPRKKRAIPRNVQCLPRTAIGQVRRPLHLEATVGDLPKPNLHSLTRLTDGNPPSIPATLRIRAGEILQIVAGAIPIRVGFRRSFGGAGGSKMSQLPVSGTLAAGHVVSDPSREKRDALRVHDRCAERRHLQRPTRGDAPEQE